MDVDDVVTVVNVVVVVPVVVVVTVVVTQVRQRTGHSLLTAAPYRGSLQSSYVYAPHDVAWGTPLHVGAWDDDVDDVVSVVVVVVVDVVVVTVDVVGTHALHITGHFVTSPEPIIASLQSPCEYSLQLSGCCTPLHDGASEVDVDDVVCVVVVVVVVDVVVVTVVVVVAVVVTQLWHKTGHFSETASPMRASEQVSNTYALHATGWGSPLQAGAPDVDDDVVVAVMVVVVVVVVAVVAVVVVVLVLVTHVLHRTGQASRSTSPTISAWQPSDGESSSKSHSGGSGLPLHFSFVVVVVAVVLVVDIQVPQRSGHRSRRDLPIKSSLHLPA